MRKYYKNNVRKIVILRKKPCMKKCFLLFLALTVLLAGCNVANIEPTEEPSTGPTQESTLQRIGKAGASRNHLYL